MNTDKQTQIAFSLIKNINADTAEKILGRVSDEYAFFAKTHDELHSLLIPENLSMEEYRSKLMKDAENELRFILANDIETLFFRDERFPKRLSNCSDSPVMLYSLGQTNLDARYVVAIVGTRHATPYGIETTKRIVSDLADRVDDLVIVSGLAYGIDVAAHKAALECGIPTVAVLAHPLNTIYPADHRGVAVQILKSGGSLITEYATCHEVHRANFLARNRIVAGLADATIVVESAEKGGSLTTAGIALEYGREVFAVPGRLTDKYSKGSNGLISSGRAHVYFSADDLIEELGWEKRKCEGEQLSMALTLSAEEEAIYEFLIQKPGSTVNDIMLSTQIPAIQIKNHLFNMEMRDLVMSMAGGKYSAL